MSKDHDNGISNPTDNRPFHDVLQTRISRRRVLTGGLAVATTAFFGGAASGFAAEDVEKSASDPTGLNKKNGLIGFEPVKVADGSGPWPSISPDYQYQVLIPWGTPIKSGVRAYDGEPNRRPTSAEQAEQIGIGHDGMWFFPIGDSNDHGLLAINHEFGTNFHVLGKKDPESPEDVRVSQHAHGVSVAEIKKIDGTWQLIPDSPKARRIHVNTPMSFGGPVAGHPLLQTKKGNAPLGTVSNIPATAIPARRPFPRKLPEGYRAMRPS